MWPSPKKHEYSSTAGSKNAQKQATKLKRLIYFFFTLIAGGTKV